MTQPTTQATINVRMDRDLKNTVEEICREMGMSMTTAFTLFAKRLARDRRIPFEVSAIPHLDPPLAPDPSNLL